MTAPPGNTPPEVMCRRCGKPTTSKSGKHSSTKRRCPKCGRCTSSQGLCPECLAHDRDLKNSPICSECLQPISLQLFERQRKANVEIILHDCGRVLYQREIPTWADRHALVVDARRRP